MPDVFIALEEAAAFESVSYKTLTQRIYRNPQQYKTKSQAREGGGKDQVLISTSSLSAKARKAWRAAQKVEGSEVIIDKRAQEAVPWYVTADLNQYTEANKKRFYEAVELAARVQDFIDYDGPDRTGYAERYALGLGISPQSLYRYMKNVLEANAWALKLEKEDGKSRDYFRALALCRKPKETGTFPSLTDEQKAIIENIWFDKRFAANLGTIEMLYERFELEAERREWEEYPSIKTVARYIKFLMGQRGAESARFLAANGTREWKNKRMMKGKRDATSLQVMEYVVGDEHTFDFWVQWTAPNGKIKAVRPKLVAWLDTANAVAADQSQLHRLVQRGQLFQAAVLAGQIHLALRQPAPHLDGDVAVGGNVLGILRRRGKIGFQQQKIHVLRLTLPDHILAVVGEDAQGSASPQPRKPVCRPTGHSRCGKAYRRSGRRRLRSAAGGQLPLLESAHPDAPFAPVSLDSHVPHSGQYTATSVTTTPQPGQQRWRAR